MLTAAWVKSGIYVVGFEDSSEHYEFLKVYFFYNIIQKDSNSFVLFNPTEVITQNSPRPQKIFPLICKIAAC